MGVLVSVPRFVAAGFVPTDIAGCSLWLDSSDTATITHSSNAVSQWNDKSGNANHFTQATSTKRPITNTVTVNGKNAIDFDGTDDYLVGPLLTTATDNVTMFVVVAPDATPGVETVPFFIGTGSNDGYGPALRSQSSSFVGFLQGGVAWHQGTVTWPISGAHILSLIRTSGTSSYRYDKVEDVTTASVPKTPTSLAVIGVHAPTYGGDVNFMNGAICEALFWPSALSGADRLSVENYLSAKWGTP